MVMTNLEDLERKLLEALEEEAEEVGEAYWNDLRNQLKSQASGPPGHSCPGGAGAGG